MNWVKEEDCLIDTHTSYVNHNSSLLSMKEKNINLRRGHRCKGKSKKWNSLMHWEVRVQKNPNTSEKDSLMIISRLLLPDRSSNPGRWWPHWSPQHKLGQIVQPQGEECRNGQDYNAYQRDEGIGGQQAKLVVDEKHQHDACDEIQTMHKRQSMG